MFVDTSTSTKYLCPLPTSSSIMLWAPLFAVDSCWISAFTRMNSGTVLMFGHVTSEQSCLVPSHSYVALDERFAEGRWPIRSKARLEKVKLWICFCGPISHRFTKDCKLRSRILKHSWSCYTQSLKQTGAKMAENVTPHVVNMAGKPDCFVNGVKHRSTFGAPRGDQISKHADELYQVFWNSQTPSIMFI